MLADVLNGLRAAIVGARDGAGEPGPAFTLRPLEERGPIEATAAQRSRVVEVVATGVGELPMNVGDEMIYQSATIEARVTYSVSDWTRPEDVALAMAEDVRRIVNATRPPDKWATWAWQLIIDPATTRIDSIYGESGEEIARLLTLIYTAEWEV